MRIFNLAEELEKERKKNKELEKYLKCKKEYTKYLPEDVEFVLLTKPDYDRHQEELQDKVFELQERIDKATKELINIDGNLAYGKTSDRICYVIDILEGDNK